MNIRGLHFKDGGLGSPRSQLKTATTNCYHYKAIVTQPIDLNTITTAG